MSAKVERRDYRAALALDGSKLVGRAANYGVRSHDLGGFVEILEPGCFTRTLGGDRPSGLGDITAHYNHDQDTLLGRTISGTLRVWEDAEGIAFEVDLPDTQLGRDIAVLVGRGDLAGCSFGMLIRDKWSDASGSGIPVRHVTDVDLIEVSIVQRPAYPETEVALRSLDAERRQRGEYEAWLSSHQNLHQGR